MRQIVAEAVQNGAQFDEAMLGKSKSEYAEWIRKQESWGGACACDWIAARSALRFPLHVQAI